MPRESRAVRSISSASSSTEEEDAVVDSSAGGANERAVDNDPSPSLVALSGPTKHTETARWNEVVMGLRRKETSDADADDV
mmetsp:Transcript_53023/g.112645  ORF Transcript_53023/g.112645 Transcript_53023/m.112645 type:complete len:81 (+) Transcript_53023:1052-1294(+)